MNPQVLGVKTAQIHLNFKKVGLNPVLVTATNVSISLLTYRC